MTAVLERNATFVNLAPEARCLYDIYRKEGDELYCKRRYKKALLSYNEALRLVDRHPQTLVARSRCYMGIGMMQKALEDTELALSINASYLPAMYQKGQILYRQGNYDMALITFNRGHKLNPGAPGFLEGIQKAQHALDIMAAGRTMKTTVVGDLSLYLPKKQSSFQAARKTLPNLGSKSMDAMRLPSPGFAKRHGTLLLQVQKRPLPGLGEPSFGREEKHKAKVNDKSMKEILGQLYDDKAYFERILNSAGDGKNDLNEMLSSVLEGGLKFLYDRVLFWAQNNNLPPAPPPPPKALNTRKQPVKTEEPESEEETEDEEREGESSEELVKVNEAIDAVSSVNDPEGVYRKRKLKVRKRRADILKKRSSMVVVTKKKAKKAKPRRDSETVQEEPDMDASRINFQFSSLPVHPEESSNDVKPDGSKVSFGDNLTYETETESEMFAVDEVAENMEKERMERREKRRQEKEERRRLREEEKKKEEESRAEEKVDPLVEYLDKMMDDMERIYQKGDFKTLKTKAESFLLTMEKYDVSVTGTKMGYVGRAHSFLGNAHVGLRNYDFAMMHYEKDLEIGQRWKQEDCVSRALGNLGRVHVYTRKYSTALTYLAQKSKMTNTPTETAWLYHEIASCFLQLHHYQFARDAAQKSLQAAAECGNTLYQLQSSVLLGAIEVKLQNFERAYGSFERAMDHAKLRDDEKAQQAIAEALKEVNERLAQQAREQQEQKITEEAEGQTNDQCPQEGHVDRSIQVSVADSARNTGDDPELARLVTDDDLDNGKNAKNTTAVKNGDDKAKDEEGVTKTADDNDTTNESVKKEETNETDGTEPAAATTEANQDDAENTETIKNETESDLIANAEDHGTDNPSDATEKKDDADAQAEGAKSSGEDEAKDGEVQNEKDGADAKTAEQANIAVVVTAPPTREGETGEDNSMDEKGESKDENNQDHLQTPSDRMQREGTNVSSDVTYKERPITTDSIAKSMSADGKKVSVKKSVVTLNEELRESESRRNSPHPGERIQDSTKKKVTIAPEEVVDGESNKGGEEDKKAEEKPEEKPEPKEPRGKDPISDKMEDELLLMEKEYTQKEFDQLLKRGNDMMKSLKKVRNIDRWSKRRLQGFAKLHSFMGSANSEKQNFDKARNHHNADLKIGEAIADTKIQSRAYEHLGRTYIFEKKYEKALEFFAKRAHLPRDTDETARLFHEIANCFFLLRAYEFSRDAAMVSMKAAAEGKHLMFQLQSSVLIAVTKVKLKDVEGALNKFDDALKYATIRDDQQAAQAIREAIKQIETKLASDVRDKWLKKIRKTAPAPDQVDGGNTSVADGKEGEESNIFSLLNSMKEEDEELEAAEGATNPEGEATDTNQGSETSRTDKNGFLLAPEGPMDQTSKFREKIVKIHQVENEDGRKNVKKKKPAENPAPVSPSKAKTPRKTVIKSKGKENQGKNAKQNQPKSETDVKSKTESETGPGTMTEGEALPHDKDTHAEDDSSKATVTPKSENVAAVASDVMAAVAENETENETTEPGGKQEENGESAKTLDYSKETGEPEKKDNEKKQDNENENSTTQEQGNNEADEEKPASAEVKADEDKDETAGVSNNENANVEKERQSSKKRAVSESEKDTRKTKGSKGQEKTKTPNTAGSETNRSQGKQSQKYIAPKPKLKPKPAPKTEEELEQERQAAKERRMSQRFIGLDPRKVAEMKENPPKSTPEKEIRSPKKPKTERFVGLKPKAEPKERDTNKEINGKDVTGDTPRTKRSPEVPADKKETDQSGKSPKSQNPSPRANHSQQETNNDDADYDGNVPTTPIMILSEDVPMARHDSIGNKGNQRPATSVSIADLVKDDIVMDKKMTSSQAELHALNVLVQDAIHRETRSREEMNKKNLSPTKSQNRKSNEHSLKNRRDEELEMEAAVKRARRHRFLKNRKASFVLMLTSPYAGTSSLYSKKNTNNFTLLRRKASKAHPGMEDGEFGSPEEDSRRGLKRSPREGEDANKTSPRLGGQHNSPLKKLKTDPSGLFGGSLGKEEADTPEDRNNKNNKYPRNEKAEASRIEQELEMAAKEMRRRERSERREMRRQLQEAERKRRQDEKEEKELQSLSPRVTYSNPYDKLPSRIPGMSQRKFFDEEEERQWIMDEERKLRREKRRERREKELRRREEEGKRRRKLELASKKKTKRSPRTIAATDFNLEGEDAEVQSTPMETPQESPISEMPVSPYQEDEEDPEEPLSYEKDDGEDDQEEEKEEEEEGIHREQEEEPQKPNEEEMKARQRQEDLKKEEEESKIKEEANKSNKEGDKKKKEKDSKEKEEEERRKEEESKRKEEDRKKKEEENKKREEAKKSKIEEDKKKEEEDKKKEDEKKEQEDEGEKAGAEPEKEKAEEDVNEEEAATPVADDFDGFNDDEEDDGDLVAIYIEKEARQMRKDYNEGQIPAVIKRGNDLLKALRKHTDIVSWSRRRLRWFGIVHSYMGSSYADNEDYDKARSHHQADFRIGEALEDPKMQSRALEHLARVYMNEKNVPKALEQLAKRAHFPRDSEQSARLFHEMANCFFQMGAVEYARDAAVQSLEAAQEGKHATYLLQSALLIAVCQSKLKDYDQAQTSFESALSQARLLDDHNTEAAINDALKQLELKRASFVRDKWKGKKNKVNETIEEDGEE